MELFLFFPLNERMMNLLQKVRANNNLYDDMIVAFEVQVLEALDEKPRVCSVFLPIH
jgi:hypothetical protein